MFKHLDDIKSYVRSFRERKRLVLSSADEPHAVEAVYHADKEGIIKAILVGDKRKISEICTAKGIDPGYLQVINEPDPDSAIVKSIELINSGDADILMKGRSSTASLLRGILNKERGMRRSELLSHFALFEIPSYHKLLALTDVAININPGLEEKVGILKNAVEFMNGLGWENPKVAVIAAVETVNPSMTASLDAAALSIMNRRGQIRNCSIDGPMALDSAIDAKSALQKNIGGEVGGDADLLLFPQLESGNVMYKTLAFLSGARSASVVLGAAAPVVLTSRADSIESKLSSIMLAAADRTILKD